MKTLYLVRHAKSSRKDAELPDFERPLNKRGKRDAPLMGKVLKKGKIRPDLILSSPAKRAIVTARSIAKKIGFPTDNIQTDQLIYEGAAEDLLRVIHAIDDGLDSAMIFGHNPPLTELANDLSDQPVENIPTCGVFCVAFDVNSWKEISTKSGIFKFLDYPKKHV